MQNRMKPPAPEEVDRMLPVRAPAFAVLAALADGPRPGIEILDRVNSTVRRPRLFGPGTLYRLLREMRDARLIARAGVEAEEGTRDDRRVHHALTPLGEAVLAAETERLQATLKLARAAGVRP
jgi:DNA-binding PadR family transcriptional regulator